MSSEAVKTFKLEKKITKPEIKQVSERYELLAVSDFYCVLDIILYRLSSCIATHE